MGSFYYKADPNKNVSFPYRHFQLNPDGSMSQSPADPLYEQQERWDRRFLELAAHISSWSKDPKTHVGCVIVDDKRRVISVGYNGFPRYVNDDSSKYEDRETKCKFVCHADRNALDNAPCSVEGMTMYITHPPCTECQKSIIQKGIRRVVWYKASERFKEIWGDGFDILAQVYNSGNIQVQTYDKTKTNPSNQ
jgi:dCMP deaminase